MGNTRVWNPPGLASLKNEDTLEKNWQKRGFSFFDNFSPRQSDSSFAQSQTSSPRIQRRFLQTLVATIRVNGVNK